MDFLLYTPSKVAGETDQHSAAFAIGMVVGGLAVEFGNFIRGDAQPKVTEELYFCTKNMLEGARERHQPNAFMESFG